VASVESVFATSGSCKALNVRLRDRVYSPRALSPMSVLYAWGWFPSDAIAQALKACWKWSFGSSAFNSGKRYSMKPLVLPCRGTKIKLETKWHDACCSTDTDRVGPRRRPGDGGSSLSSGDRLWSDSVSDEAACLPSFAAMALLFALRALFSVASVSFRKTRSNSSLYPGHCRRDLLHWLHVGFVSSHYPRRSTSVCPRLLLLDPSNRPPTLILRVLHIWQPREGLPQYTMVVFVDRPE
jgi:hypothetical protein